MIDESPTPPTKAMVIKAFIRLAFDAFTRITCRDCHRVRWGWQRCPCRIRRKNAGGPPASNEPPTPCKGGDETLVIPAGQMRRLEAIRTCWVDTTGVRPRIASFELRAGEYLELVGGPPDGAVVTFAHGDLVLSPPPPRQPAADQDPGSW